MRHRSKTVLLALAATLAISALASASASAAPQWKINGSPFTGEEQVKITGAAPLVFKTTLGASKVVIECKQVSSTSAKIDLGNKGSASLTLEKCSWVEPAGCIMPSSLSTPSLNFGLEDAVAGKEPIFSKFESTHENTLVSWLQTGCSLEQAFSFTGTPRCQLNKPAIQQVSKLCEFAETSGSAVFFGYGKVTATLLGSIEMALSGVNKGKAWSAAP